MKTYVLMVSQQFPKTHKKAGAYTHFPSLIKAFTKKHTLRNNYELWEKRILEVKAGWAVLSLRVWEGMPYNSKQREIQQFDSKSDIGIQKLSNPDKFVWASVGDAKIDWDVIAENDGLDFEDFCDWFKSPGSDPMAIIHFTNFRYPEK